MKYTITDNNIHIVDSYRICKDDIVNFLCILKRIKGPNMVFNNRPISSLANEWYVHNLLYSMHLFRSHTKDVDLNYPCELSWVYDMIGPIAKIFIK